MEPMKGALDAPRKVRVMAGRWPGDDEPDRSLVYFKKYVKVCQCLVGLEPDFVWGKEREQEADGKLIAIPGSCCCRL